MLGLIFTSLGEMVESRFGIAFWNQIIRETEMPDDGAFTLGESYPDERMVKLVMALSKKLEVSPENLLREFGEFVVSALITHYPELVNRFSHPKELLMHVDDYIHKEISFYHPNQAEVPTFTCVDKGENSLEMYYRSPRKLCFLAEGIIQGIGQHFQRRIILSHSRCMHKGDEECLFEIGIDG